MNSSPMAAGGVKRPKAGTTSASCLKTVLALVGWLALCFSAASLGAFFMPGEWYLALKKPSWNPPGWIFGPVWTALYTMMAVAAWLVWKRGGFAAQRRALALFLAQLALNAAWTRLRSFSACTGRASPSPKS